MTTLSASRRFRQNSVCHQLRNKLNTFQKIEINDIHNLRVLHNYSVVIESSSVILDQSSQNQSLFSEIDTIIDSEFRECYVEQLLNLTSGI